MSRRPVEMRHSEVDESVNAVSGQAVDAAIEVHRELGPGLLERAYHVALKHELESRGLQVAAEVEAPLVYKGVRLSVGYRLDLVVEESVVVELKAIEALQKVHFAQVSTYLKLSRIPVGLLVNFNSVPLHRGIHRIVRGDLVESE